MFALLLVVTSSCSYTVCTNVGSKFDGLLVRLDVKCSWWYLVYLWDVNKDWTCLLFRCWFFSAISFYNENPRTNHRLYGYLMDQLYTRWLVTPCIYGKTYLEDPRNGLARWNYWSGSFTGLKSNIFELINYFR